MHRATASTASGRLTLLPYELAWLLEVPCCQVVGLIERGELPNASRSARKAVGFEDALELVRRRTARGECSPLAEFVLEELRTGRLEVSRAEASTLTLVGALERSATAEPIATSLHETT